MLLPGVRLVERPGVLHFFDGRRVVSVRGDDAGRAALRHAAEATGPIPGDAGTGETLRAADEVLAQLKLSAEPRRADSRLPGPAGLVTAEFASAAVSGWVSSGDAARRLQDTEVCVWDSPEHGLLRTLAASGIATRALESAAEIADLDPRRSVVAVVAADAHPVDRLRVTNSACLAAGISWLPVGTFDGARLHVGPLLIPGETACADCLLRRLAANVAYADIFGAIVDVPAAPTPAALRSWSYSIAALVLALWITNQDSRLPGRLLSLVPADLSIRQAQVFRVPRCTVCAGPDFITAAAPWGSSRDH